jgi:hypothetical protein
MPELSVESMFTKHLLGIALQPRKACSMITRCLSVMRIETNLAAISGSGSRQGGGGGGLFRPRFLAAFGEGRARCKGLQMYPPFLFPRA